VLKIGIYCWAILASLSTAAETGPTTPDWSPLIARLDQLRADAEVPAMGLVLLDDGLPVTVRTFGTAAPDTPFRWGSISKSFTALAALQLVHDYNLELTSAIRPLLGDGYYVNDWAAQHSVQLHELLELSAGFTDLSREEFVDNVPHPLWTALTRNQTERRTLWPPGLQHSYSNVPPGLTAAVIEKVSGLTFETFLELNVLLPLEMEDASFNPVPDLPGGYKADGRTELPYWHVTFKAFGALNASVTEMANFTSTLLNDGQLGNRQALAPELIEEFFTPMTTLGARQGLEISYAAGVYGWVRNGHVFWGHGGDADGYRSRYGLLRSHGRGYVLVINTDNPDLLRQLQREVEITLTRDLPDHPPPPVSNESLDSYVGTYYPAASRFSRDRWQAGESQEALVRLQENVLSFTRGNRTTRLIPMGMGRFRRPGDPAVTVVFARDSDGALYIQGELGNFLNLSSTPCPGFLERCK
jgi:CubicO group peptidase (beta-lactamase class C family)